MPTSPIRSTRCLSNHRTTRGEDILTGGFRDARGTSLTSQMWNRVWLSDQPLDANEGVNGDDVLVVEMPEDVIAPFE